MLDAHLVGGGFPIGGLSEIYGAPSSGRMSLALLAETLGRGVHTAWIDPAVPSSKHESKPFSIGVGVRPIRIATALLPLPRHRRTSGLCLARALDDVVPEAIGELIEGKVQPPASRGRRLGTAARPSLVEERKLDRMSGFIE